jgi:hypothetical protein
MTREKQLTNSNHNHILSNAAVWSPDGEWIVYDVRSDRLGARFDGTRIERVHADSGRVELLCETRHGAHCGAATCNPTNGQVVFILGPEHPSPDWQYAPHHRQGAIIDANSPGQRVNLDARELTPPFLPGALRGGTHLHLFSGDGKMVSFTYEDHLLATSPGREINQRNIGVTALGHPVRASSRHPRNHDGAGFSVLVTRTIKYPKPGSDEISRAAEEAWIGTNGYIKLDGARQKRAIAFQGEVTTSDGERMLEAFIVDIPNDLTIAGDKPLEGTATTPPRPPKGTNQRRLTFTADQKYPGLVSAGLNHGPRHWLRSNPRGTHIAMLMRNFSGIVQLFIVSPNGGEPAQITQNRWSIASAFTWSPDGSRIACVIDNSIFVTDIDSGKSTRITERSDDATAPLPLACVFSPDGKRIAYLRTIGEQNQLFVARVG